MCNGHGGALRRRVNSSRSSAGSIALARNLRLKIARMRVNPSTPICEATASPLWPMATVQLLVSVPDNGSSSNQPCSVFAGRGFGTARALHAQRAGLHHAGKAGPDLRDLDQEDGHAHPRRDGPRASPAACCARKATPTCASSSWPTARPATTRSSSRRASRAPGSPRSSSGY